MVIAVHEEILFTSAAWPEFDVFELNKFIRFRAEECRSKGAGRYPSPFRRKAVDARWYEEVDILGDLSSKRTPKKGRFW